MPKLSSRPLILFVVATAAVTLFACASSSTPGDGAGGDAGSNAQGEGGADDQGIFAAQACNADFCWQYPTPIGAKILAIHPVSDDVVFAVSEGGGLLRKSKAGWGVAITKEAKTLRGVWASSEKNVWAVGDSGNIVHYNGTSLETFPAGITEDLMAVWGADESHVWAVGASGSIVAWDGSAWGVATKTGDELHAIWGAGPNDVWAVGGTENISVYSHWDGSTWTTTRSSMSGAGLYAIHGTTNGAVWAVGGYGYTYRLDPDGWRFAGGVARDEGRLGAVHVNADGTLVAWTETRAYTYDGSAWKPGAAEGAIAVGAAPKSDVVWRADGTGNVFHGTEKPELATGSVLTGAVNGAGKAFVALNSGDLLVQDGAKWNVLGKAHTFAPADAHDVNSGVLADGNIVIGVGGTGSQSTFRVSDGKTVFELPPLTQSAYPYHIGGKNASDVWVFAYSIFHLEGQTWVKQKPTNFDIAAIDATHGDVPWFVGAGGNTVTIENGTVVTHPIPDGKDVYMTSVWASGNEAWAAGVFTDTSKGKDEGFIVYPTTVRLYHYTGTKWEEVDAPADLPQGQYHGVERALVSLSASKQISIAVEGGSSITKNFFTGTPGAWQSKRCPVQNVRYLWSTDSGVWVGSGTFPGPMQGLLKSK